VGRFSRRGVFLDRIYKIYRIKKEQENEAGFGRIA
jgi:hypothetical protein